MHKDGFKNFWIFSFSIFWLHVYLVVSRLNLKLCFLLGKIVDFYKLKLINCCLETSAFSDPPKASFWRKSTPFLFSILKTNEPVFFFKRRDRFVVLEQSVKRCGREVPGVRSCHNLGGPPTRHV